MQQLIEAAWQDRSLLQEKKTVNAIHEVIEALDKGQLRVALDRDPVSLL